MPKKTKALVKDLGVSFEPHPVTEDILTVTNETAVQRALYNLILTQRGERFFNPRFGCSIRSLLFEPVDYITASLMEREIEDTINLYEPRVNVHKITIYPDFDGNGYEIEILYEISSLDTINKTGDPNGQLKFFLERTK